AASRRWAGASKPYAQTHAAPRRQFIVVHVEPRPFDGSMRASMNAPAKAKMPSQIPFIIANEGCERISFYGMRNILTPFLTTVLLISMPDKAMRELHAKEVFHTFVAGV